MRSVQNTHGTFSALLRHDNLYGIRRQFMLQVLQRIILFFKSKLQRRVCGFCFLREFCKFAPSWHTALFVSVREKEGELYSWRFIYLFWLNVSSKEKDLSASNIFFNNILMNFSPIKAEKLLTFMHVLGFLKLTFKNAVKVNNTNKRKCSVTFTELY